MKKKKKKKKPALMLRVWWIPQVPMKSFLVPVTSFVMAKKLLDVFADYDGFQLDNNIKPDYSNAGGLSVFDPDDTEDSPEGSWVDWENEEGDHIDDLGENVLAKLDKKFFGIKWGKQ